jgi:hypothetical protein
MEFFRKLFGGRVVTKEVDTQQQLLSPISKFNRFYRERKSSSIYNS